MSGAALDSPQDAAPASLIVKTEGNSVTLVNFDPQKLTNQQLDLVFPAGVQCEFSVRQNRSGPSSKKSKSSSGNSCSISVSGYLQPSPFDYVEEPTSSKKRKRSRGIDGISSSPIESQKKAKLGEEYDDEGDSDDEDYDIEDLDSGDEDDEVDEFGSEEMLDSDEDDEDDGNGPNLDEVLSLGDISSSSGDDGDEEAKEPVVVTKKSKKKEKKATKKDKKQKKAKKNSDVPTPDNPEQSVEKPAETVEFPLSKSQKKKLKKEQKKLQKAAAATKAKKNSEDSAKSPETAAADKKPKKKNDSDESDKKSAAVPEKKKAAPVEQKKKPQIKEQNGVKYLDFQVGTGKSVKQGKRVKVLYVGTLAKNGKQFDKSMQYPFSFKLGKGEVIKGWDVGIQGMKVGGRRKLLIPSALAYGAQGAPPDIPPHADLRFTVQVVE